MVHQKGGAFILSDDKIREFNANGLSYDSYYVNEYYYKAIPEFIILNSEVVKISKDATDKSLYGIIFKLTLKEGIESPIVNVKINEHAPDSGNYGKTTCSVNTFFRKSCLNNVRTFLLKLSFISTEKEIDLFPDGRKVSVKKSDFVKEAERQNLCYEKTFDFGEAVVPACISPAYIDKMKKEGRIHPILAALLIFVVAISYDINCRIIRNSTVYSRHSLRDNATFIISNIV